jgi:uncharacterized protein
MLPQVFDASMEWIAATASPGECDEITFHGGEPLLAGKEWYRRALLILQQRFEGRLKLSIQSNLWLLDDEYCDLFKEYAVSIGTSLDGPEELNDTQRGKGYFARCMAGIQTARRNGLYPGVICTFTRSSAPHYREVFEFFAGQGLSFSVHEAVCKLGGNHDETTLFPDEAAGLMVDLFDYYLENITRTQISTFDSMARGLSAQSGAICTFGNCLGGYLTIAPDGGIFSCNRFAHHPEWQLGSVLDYPDMDALARSEPWQKLRQRELTVKENCGDCTHFDYCKGGCPYNAITGGADRRDPQCTVYKKIFDHITTRALDEVFSEENLNAVVQRGPSGNGLMRKGRLIQVMKGSAHPRDLARKARETVAAVALACSASPEEAVEKLERAGIATHPQAALNSLRSLRQRLDGQSRQGLVNTYLHVTYTCNLSCSHCYAQAGPEKSASMRVEEMQRLARLSAAAGFRKIVITGGEPLAHPQRDALLDALAGLRTELKPVNIVLRTNLAYPISPDLLSRLVRSASQIVVSVDGDEASHDRQRGPGAYAHTLENLLLLKKQLSESPEELDVCLAATLPPEQIAGPQGDSVRTLAESLGFKVRFKSILPLGRGLDLDLSPAYFNSLDDSAETLTFSRGPTATCGLGMNLYIDPLGECYPCYALMGHTHALGNALEEDLSEILKHNDRYRHVTVDSNTKCRLCSLRYLCGGFCRAWSMDGPDAPPQDCVALQERARGQLVSALETLDTELGKWLAAGLPAK